MFEVEEWVGNLWHKVATRYTDQQFRHAEVALEDLTKELGIVFRAMGGDRGVRLEAAVERPVKLPRTLMQRVAGSQLKMSLPSLDSEVLALPATIAVYPDRDLNRELYLLLAAVAAQPPQAEDWVTDACARIGRLIRSYPVMAGRYRRLLQAYLPLRLAKEHLPAPLQPLEALLLKTLHDPTQPCITASDLAGLLPVPFWLYPSLRQWGEAPPRQGTDSAPDVEPGEDQVQQSAGKAAGRYVDEHDGDKGLLVFRLENLFSWSEYLQMDRTADDGPDEDVERIARDLDHLSLSRQEYGGKKRIRIDLDLPSAAEDDTPLGPGIWLPEWDYRQQELLKDHCCLQPMLVQATEGGAIPDNLRTKVQGVRAQFEQLRPLRYWQRNQSDGDEVELDRWQEFCADRKTGSTTDRPMYRRFTGKLRDLDCLLLADLSMSTDAYVDNHRRVIDVISDAMLLFAEALDSVGDRFSLYGFSSRRRQHIRFNMIKNFSEPYTDVVRGRIRALKPGYYTRIGAAIRQSTTILQDQHASRRLLLILTDGKPNDLDLYEGRYGLEDTRQAIFEARRQGLVPFCITVDNEANEYLPYLFGRKGYALVSNIEQLPAELPRLYALLAGM
ncbi:nitric oxide reductase activation protein NorD [Hahella ganghwensis]|uniref:nitric oxide reductase activation protein NorD n=1 Tax=Hahella ganghwensis TaxID=286420 RepID=UPI000376FB7D|nr:VWA domain-containing protein [Hahella ganghwensis]